MRCEGSQPSCKTCEVYHVECRYDKPPPLSQVVAMAKRLQEAELAIERLQEDASTAHPRAETSPSEETSAPEPGAVPSEDAAIPPNDSQLVSRHITVDTGNETVLPDTAAITTPGSQQDTNSSTVIAAPPTGASIANDISIDEHGKICYYGPTSAVHEPVGLDSPSANSSISASLSQRADARACLASHAKESAIWEEFALGNAAVQTGIPRQIMAKLLHQHWTWVAPMFMWVHRPSFMRKCCLLMCAGKADYI